MTDIVFVDTETTGLDPSIDDIWEFAAFRVTPYDSMTVLHMQIGHDVRRVARLLESFRTDHDARFRGDDALPQRTAARQIAQFFAPGDGGRPVFAGINPHFDATMLGRLFRRNGITDPQPPWHYHLLDVRAVAIGWLAARVGAPSDLDLSLSTDDLAEMSGITPPGDDTRHTAMGDARFAMDWWDLMTDHAARRVGAVQ